MTSAPAEPLTTNQIRGFWAAWGWMHTGYFGTFLAAIVCYTVGAHYGWRAVFAVGGTPVALTSIAFPVGLALLPLAVETKGKELPA